MKYLMKKKKAWLALLLTIALVMACLLTGCAAGPGETSDPQQSETNQTNPADEQTKPTDGQTGPTDEQTKPTDGQTEPTDEQTKPTDGQTEPTDEQTEPTEGRTEPTDEQTKPTDGQTEPTDEQTKPTDGQTEPTDEQTEPTEGRTEPTDEQTKPTEEQTKPTETTEPTQPEFTLPYALEGGKLTVDAFFQFTGMNPDCNDEYVEDVAAIQLTNNSDEHLASVNIQVVTSSGVTVSFVAYDIPGGGTAMVVSPDNLVIQGNPECAEISGKAVFLAESPLESDKIEISVMGTEITVKNVSGKALSKITVYCHSMLEQSCFGGAVYSYEIDALPAGDTTTISALECYLGMVEVVRIEIGAE